MTWSKAETLAEVEKYEKGQAAEAGSISAARKEDW